MTTTLKTLLTMKARADDARFPITELFHLPGESRFRFVALDVGGWFDHYEVLISLDRFGMPDDGVWPVNMTRQELENAPAWADDPGTSSWLPPLIVGPFGMTFSPLLASAQMQDSAEEHVVDRTQMPEDGTGRIREMDRASRWIDRDALGPDGALGQVEDVVLDDSLAMTHVDTSEGGRWPMSRLRQSTDQDHAIFD